ncbi:MAG TPA: AbrB/MazE/SpoVT family DNA-binding domain-containing protein [Verrucomicrobiae bacterium]|nr:AbrB/MazE/SpoVT family DNA-binding domain-containing protein [Verrucomicrobiae bacterium]
MKSLTVGESGEIALPPELRARYGLSSETPVRVIETRTGILLVPLTAEPMSPELIRELAEWSALAAQTWESFPYDSQRS